ncbi:MAG: hypothetical protein JST93_08535 [Acidobacteria bacterium]|nr:hypothetical protein [Acidobacteriota bacterium]
MVKRSNPMVPLYLLLVFGSGALVGAFGYRLYSANTVNAEQSQKKSPEALRQRYLKDYESRLKLNPDQMQKLVVILDETRAKYKATHDSIDPEMKRIAAEQRERINAMLDDTQRVEYGKMLEERERRRKQSSSGR